MVVLWYDEQQNVRHGRRNIERYRGRLTLKKEMKRLTLWALSIPVKLPSRSIYPLQRLLYERLPTGIEPWQFNWFAALVGFFIGIPLYSLLFLPLFWVELIFSIPIIILAKWKLVFQGDTGPINKTVVILWTPVVVSISAAWLIVLSLVFAMITGIIHVYQTGMLGVIYAAISDLRDARRELAFQRSGLRTRGAFREREDAKREAREELKKKRRRMKKNIGDDIDGIDQIGIDRIGIGIDRIDDDDNGSTDSISLLWQ